MENAPNKPGLLRSRRLQLTLAAAAAVVSLGFGAQPSNSTPVSPAQPELGPASSVERIENPDEGCAVARTHIPGQPDSETIICFAD